MRLNKLVVRLIVWALLGAALLYLQYSEVARATQFRPLFIVILICVSAAYLFFSVSSGHRQQSSLSDVERVMKAEEEDRR